MPEGQIKQREVDNASKKKIRDMAEGKNKQREVDNASKKKLGTHQKGKTKNERWIMHQRKNQK